MEVKEIISSGLLELYVTGLTSADETAQVQTWMQQYPEVKQEVEDLQTTMETYALGHAIQPDASLKNKIFQRINKTEADTTEEKDSATVIPIDENAEPVVTNEGGGIVFRIPSYFKMIAAACIVLLIVSVVINFTFYNRYRSAASDLQTAKQRFDDQKKATDIAQEQAQQQKQNKDLTQSKLQQQTQTSNTIEDQLQHQKDIAESMKQDIDIMSDKYSVPVVLKGTSHAPDALAKIFWMKNTGEVYVDPTYLPPAPAGKQYQVWAIVDGNPVSAGMITTPKGTYHIQKMKSFGKADAFAITLEKAGGSATPTMDQMYVKAKM